MTQAADWCDARRDDDADPLLALSRTGGPRAGGPFVDLT